MTSKGWFFCNWIQVIWYRQKRTSSYSWLTTINIRRMGGLAMALLECSFSCSLNKLVLMLWFLLDVTIFCNDDNIEVLVSSILVFTAVTIGEIEDARNKLGDFKFLLFQWTEEFEEVDGVLWTLFSIFGLGENTSFRFNFSFVCILYLFLWPFHDSQE